MVATAGFQNFTFRKFWLECKKMLDPFDKAWQIPGCKIENKLRLCSPLLSVDVYNRGMQLNSNRTGLHQNNVRSWITKMKENKSIFERP